MEEARAAAAADLPVLTALWATARDEIERQRGGPLLADSVITSGAPADEALRAALGDADRLVVLGTVDGIEVGFALARCQLVGGQPMGVVEAIYVEPAARQVGVGEAMVEAVLAWCAGRGCHGVDAPALPGSRPAKAFFEEHGFVARLLVMHRPLTASAPRQAEHSDHD